MPIVSLEIRNVGPFEQIEFQFDKQVNVFVGPNNAGKSAALGVLGDIVVYPFQFPRRLLWEEPAQFKIRYKYDGGKFLSKSGQLPVTNATEYWTPERFERWLSFIEKIEYTIFVPALRQSTDFRSKGPRSKEIAENRSFGQSLSSEDRQRLTEREARLRTGKILQRPKLAARLAASLGDSDYVSLDRNLIQKFIELDYRAYREKSPPIRNIIN